MSEFIKDHRVLVDYVFKIVSALSVIDCSSVYPLSPATPGLCLLELHKRQALPDLLLA